MKNSLPTLLFALALSTGMSLAAAQDQDVEPPEAAPNAEQEPTPASQEELAEGADIEEEALEDDEDGPARFIPTEEISQDLGVSFPADI